MNGNAENGKKRVKQYENLSKHFLEYLKEISIGQKPWNRSGCENCVFPSKIGHPLRAALDNTMAQNHGEEIHAQYERLTFVN